MGKKDFIRHLSGGLGHFKALNDELKDFWPEQHDLVNHHMTEVTEIFISLVQGNFNMPLINPGAGNTENGSTGTAPTTSIGTSKILNQPLRGAGHTDNGSTRTAPPASIGTPQARSQQQRDPEARVTITNLIRDSTPDIMALLDYGPVGTPPITPNGTPIIRSQQHRDPEARAAITTTIEDDAAAQKMHFVPSASQKKLIMFERQIAAEESRRELLQKDWENSKRIARLQAAAYEVSISTDRANILKAQTSKLKEEKDARELQKLKEQKLEGKKLEELRAATAERQANISRAKEALTKREAMEREAREVAAHITTIHAPLATFEILPSLPISTGTPSESGGASSIDIPPQGNLIQQISSRMPQSSRQRAVTIQTPKDEKYGVAGSTLEALSTAEVTAKKHEDKKRKAQLLIPTHSTSSSWAGVAAGGVSKEGNKPINMHAKPASPVIEHSRTLTTLGRVGSKTSTAYAISADIPTRIKQLVIEVFPPYEYRHEALVDQYRAVCIMNPPASATIQVISDGIREGALASIRPLQKTPAGIPYYLVIFQFAPCAASFLKVMEEERRSKSKTRRFSFDAECIRGPLQQRDAVLHAMDDPNFARRRLTLAQKGLFFEWKKTDIEEFVYKYVPKDLVQFVHCYNGGNATICFTEVVAAAMIKKVLAKMKEQRTDGGKWMGMHVTFSKDPCETELRLISDFPGGRRSLAWTDSSTAA